MASHKQTFKIKVLCEDPNIDGSIELVLDFDDNFKKLFLEQTGLKRYSGKRFQTWFVQGLQQGLQYQEK